ncbi:MAG: glycosyltransferase [Thermoanaerobacteraceae bacterium]|nr:glycosyltransferase [Thermoanaerobacteraceae bacterium]
MVVDNASKDNSVLLLEVEFNNKIILIKNEDNLGFSGANNIGIKYALGRWIKMDMNMYFYLIMIRK